MHLCLAERHSATPLMGRHNSSNDTHGVSCPCESLELRTMIDWFPPKPTGYDIDEGTRTARQFLHSAPYPSAGFQPRGSSVTEIGDVRTCRGGPAPRNPLDTCRPRGRFSDHKEHNDGLRTPTRLNAVRGYPIGAILHSLAWKGSIQSYLAIVNAKGSVHYSEGFTVIGQRVASGQ